MEDFLLWRARSKSFQNLAAFTADRFTLTGDGRAEVLAGADVSADFFGTLGVRPLLGRTFVAGADQPGLQSTAVISERLWRGKFAGRDEVLNKNITLDGRPVDCHWHHAVQLSIPFAGCGRMANSALSTPGPASVPVHLRRGVARLKEGVSVARPMPKWLASPGRLSFQSKGCGTSSLSGRVAARDESSVTHVPLIRALAGAGLSWFCSFPCSTLPTSSRQGHLAAAGMVIGLQLALDFAGLFRQSSLESAMLVFTGGAVGVLLAALSIRALQLLAPPGIPPSTRHDRHGWSCSVVHVGGVNSLWNDLRTYPGICGYSQRSHAASERKRARNRREWRTSNASQFAGGCRDRAFSGAFGMCRTPHSQLSDTRQRADWLYCSGRSPHPDANLTKRRPLCARADAFGLLG